MGKGTRVDKRLSPSVFGKPQKIVGAYAEIAGELENRLGTRFLLARFPIADRGVA